MFRYITFLGIIMVYLRYTESGTIKSIAEDFYEPPVNMTQHKETSLLEIEANGGSNTKNSVSKVRFKRQQSSGAGKFTEAAQVPQIKLLRLFLTMFSNTWVKSHTGGSHPFHPYVPKPIVKLFKHRIMEFFFPEIGEEAIKKD